ncbi:MAG: thioesterase family protein [Rhodobiaceae bacterium]|jgi:hypothetical protein|nr:thioesterase family protein [Rhodobiaceae bacterium]
MKTYSDIMGAFLATGPEYVADLPDNWKQGRTAFGGLTTALLAAAIQQDTPELPPLRTAQINFIGPAIDALSVSHKLLRQGKNNVTFSAELNSPIGAGTHGHFTYGVTRELPREIDYPLKAIDKKPEDVETFFPAHKDAPSFLQNLDRRLISGPRFMEGSDHPDILMWARLTDPMSWDKGLLPLLVLADTPPAALTFFDGPVRALSSMNWNINFLTDKIETEDGWWLMRSATRYVRDGYSSQLTQVWNSEGRRVMDAMQLQAVFV